MLDLSKRGLEVIFPKPWMTTLYFTMLDGGITMLDGGTLTSLQAMKILKATPEPPSRTAVINFLKKMVDWGLLYCSPEIVESRLQFGFRAKPLQLWHDTVNLELYPNTREGFKNYISLKLKEQLEAGP